MTSRYIFIFIFYFNLDEKIERYLKAIQDEFSRHLSCINRDKFINRIIYFCFFTQLYIIRVNNIKLSK